MYLSAPIQKNEAPIQAIKMILKQTDGASCSLHDWDCDFPKFLFFAACLDQDFLWF